MQSFPGKKPHVLHERKSKGEHLPQRKTHGRWTKREKREMQAMMQAREELERMKNRPIIFFGIL